MSFRRASSTKGPDQTARAFRFSMLPTAFMVRLDYAGGNAGGHITYRRWLTLTDVAVQVG